MVNRPNLVSYPEGKLKRIPTTSDLRFRFWSEYFRAVSLPSPCAIAPCCRPGHRGKVREDRNGYGSRKERFQTAKLRRGCPNVARDRSTAGIIPGYCDFTTSSASRETNRLPDARRAGDPKSTRSDDPRTRHRPGRTARASAFGAPAVAPRPLSDRKIAVRLTRPCPRWG